MLTCTDAVLEAGILPHLLDRHWQGVFTFDVAFQTTREICPPAQDVPTAKPGLHMYIEDGLSSLEKFALAGGSEAFHAGRVDIALAVHTSARAAKMRTRFNPEPDLLVVYLSSAGWKADVTRLAEIRDEHPRLIIIAVACVHQQAAAEDVRLILGPTGYLVITPECGGDATMGRLRDIIVRAWHNR